MSLILPILFILCFFLAVVAICLSYLVNGVLNVWNGIMRTLFGSSPRRSDFGWQQHQGTKARTSANAADTGSSSRQERKIFAADEGTYVDFEEI